MTLLFSSLAMVYDAPGTWSGPRRFLYLLYGFYPLYFDLWQVQVESSPMEAPRASSALSPAMVSLAPSPTK
jgi:hypothetical protein